jgi:hypothetical protein
VDWQSTPVALPLHRELCFAITVKKIRQEVRYEVRVAVSALAMKGLVLKTPVGVGREKGSRFVNVGCDSRCACAAHLQADLLQAAISILQRWTAYLGPLPAILSACTSTMESGAKNINLTVTRPACAAIRSYLATGDRSFCAFDSTTRHHPCL